MLAVGDSTTLEIVFSTGHYTNEVVKAPSITTNERRQPRVIRIKSNIVKEPDSAYPIMIQPWSIEFASGTIADKVEFTITNKATTPLRPRMVSGPGSGVTVSLPSVIPGSGSATGTVRLEHRDPSAAIEKSVTIELDDAARSRFTIPIHRPKQG